jgi:hypothetical protein
LGCLPGAFHSKAVPVNIPVKPLVPRPPIRNSIEGLNQEIERLVLKSNGAQDTEREEEKVGMYFLFQVGIAKLSL